jgi:hypothetical protein
MNNTELLKALAAQPKQDLTIPYKCPNCVKLVDEGIDTVPFCSEECQTEFTNMIDEYMKQKVDNPEEV